MCKKEDGKDKAMKIIMKNVPSKESCAKECSSSTITLPSKFFVFLGAGTCGCYRCEKKEGSGTECKSDECVKKSTRPGATLYEIAQ